MNPDEQSNEEKEILARLKTRLEEYPTYFEKRTGITFDRGLQQIQAPDNSEDRGTGKPRAIKVVPEPHDAHRLQIFPREYGSVCQRLGPQNRAYRRVCFGTEFS
jgi:hypothetical protein